jgi:RHS repeat-associated protein
VQTFNVNTSNAFLYADTTFASTNQLVVARYLYDPCGNTLSVSGPLAEANLYRFSSKEWHPNSGLVYYLYRYYDGSLQRWVNRDPLGDEVRARTWHPNLVSHVLHRIFRKGPMERSGPANSYSFVYNSPLAWFDSDGLLPDGYNPPPIRYDPAKRDQPSPCAQAIGDSLRMIYLGNNGIGGWPAANNDDSVQHCITSCKLARACGSGVAWFLGWIKESNDLIHGGSATETDKDLEDNAHGRMGVNCPGKSCEDYCQQTCSEYR